MKEMKKWDRERGQENGRIGGRSKRCEEEKREAKGDLKAKRDQDPGEPKKGSWVRSRRARRTYRPRLRYYYRYG